MGLDVEDEEDEEDAAAVGGYATVQPSDGEQYADTNAPGESPFGPDQSVIGGGGARVSEVPYGAAPE